MENFDQAEEYRRLEELYAQMSDDQIAAIGDRAEDLFDIARRVLRAEISKRGLDTQSQNAPLEGDDPTAFDLVGVWSVKDASEARLVMGILDSAGVKSFLGPDNVENVDDFKGSFDDGVGIQVMNFQSQYAVGGLRRRFQPEPEEDTPDDKDYAILCPKCNSPDTVFRGLDVEPSGRLAPDAKNNWSCDACGHQWKDDGIVEKP